nr:reverse transcriptase domain-containing protein [Tanacetum cinerariifolium]GEZ38259.1 reverse transcriptase domain-containing protein [Tanacetum cinerariifolium]
MAQMRAAVPSTYHSLLPSGTPPLLPIPLPVPSTSRRAEIPEADTPPRKRLLLTAPRPGCEVGESYAAATTRQPGPTMAPVRAKIEVLRRERLAYEQESIQIHESLARSEAYSRTLEARVAVLETQKKMAPKRTTRSTADQETTNTTSVTKAQLQAMIDQGVTTALAARDALRSTNGDDSHNSRTGVRRTERATREYNYTDFLNNCAPENQVKFATCTLHSVDLTWWNTQVKTVGHDAAYGMPWKTLMTMMTDNYCPRNEIKKLEMEIWDLKVKGTDLTSYTQRFQELALLCGRMFSEESDKIEKYIKGLPDMIHESVVASIPKTMQEAVAIATELMDQKLRTFAERKMASKRKLENTSRSTQNQQQQPNKR